jgi:hypothetical protein
MPKYQVILAMQRILNFKVCSMFRQIENLENTVLLFGESNSSVYILIFSGFICDHVCSYVDMDNVSPCNIVTHALQ